MLFKISPTGSRMILAGLLISPAGFAMLSETHSISDTPFSSVQDGTHDVLPDLGSSFAANQNIREQRLAEMAQSLGKAIGSTDAEGNYRQSVSEWLFDQFKDQLAQQVVNTGQDILSPYGKASIDLNVNMEGNFTGTSSSLFTPWYDKYHVLTYSQISLNQNQLGTVGSLGAGQRFGDQQVLLGYNAFLEQLFDGNQRRASLGTELWSHYLRLSANYYAPLTDWRTSSATQQQRLARGFDVTSQGFLPFYQKLAVSLRWQQYLGDDIDVFNSGNDYHNPRSVSVGLTYTPVPLVTFSATHQAASGGESQDVFGLKLNYRLGESFEQQLLPEYVADPRSLTGSRYDAVTRNNVPVMGYRKHHPLDIFIATPPLQINPGDSVRLILQVSAAKNISNLVWHGDTQALSLTAPTNKADLTGWTIIVPAWDSAPDATNEYHLSVTIEAGGEISTSNTITIRPQQPLLVGDTTGPDEGLRF